MARFDWDKVHREKTLRDMPAAASERYVAMKLRRRAACTDCGKKLAQGQGAYWAPASKLVRCQRCGENRYHNL